MSAFLSPAVNLTTRRVALSSPRSICNNVVRPRSCIGNSSGSGSMPHCSSSSIRYLATKGKGRAGKARQNIKLSKPTSPSATNNANATAVEQKMPFKVKGPPRYGIGAESATSASGRGESGAFDARHALGILVVFPVVALGTLIVFNDDLQDQFMERWDKNSHRAKKEHDRKVEGINKGQEIINRAREEAAITAGLPVGDDRTRAKNGIAFDQPVRTSRLVLRRPRTEDVPEIFAGYASDPDVTRYISWPRHKSIEDTMDFIRFSDDEWAKHSFGPLLIIRSEDSAIIGCTGLTFPSSKCGPDEAEGGYILAKDCWGQGYASEAYGKVIELAEKAGIRRVISCVHPDNAASVHVLVKLGFEPIGECVKKLDVFPNNELGRWARSKRTLIRWAGRKPTEEVRVKNYAMKLPRSKVVEQNR